MSAILLSESVHVGALDKCPTDTTLTWKDSESR